MSATTTSPASQPVSADGHHLTFFRQSGWLMLATMAGGLLMFFVHWVAKVMPKEEYGLFTTLLQVVSLMSIPAVGLQSVFAQQAAGAMTAEHERELAGVFRGVLRGMFFIWLMMALLALVFAKPIMRELKIANPAALWITLVIGLPWLWRPILQGILQGRQNFLWLGNVMIADGIGRFGGVCVIVGWLAHYAAGAMVSVLVGVVVVMLVGGWLVRDCLTGPATPMDWPAWLRRVVPLSFGLGAGSFMLAADMIFVQKFFPKEQTGYYAAAGMIGRALVYFTMPVATVMFPKLARSKALGQKSNALALALGLTALAGAGAAIVCTFAPSLPLRIVYDRSFLEVSTPLVPWFAWSMLPLTLAMVLLNGLMAHARFESVPWLVLVAAGYGAALYFRHDSFTQVIRTLGVFSLLLLAVCAWFTWGAAGEEPDEPEKRAAGDDYDKGIGGTQPAS